MIFYICLLTALALFIGGFFCPPMGVIDGSILKAAGILLGFAALGIVGHNLSLGKEITFTKDDLNVTIGDNNNEDNE